MSYLSNSPVAGLVAKAQHAKTETFELLASAWNEAIEAYRSTRPLVIKGDYRGDWLHPWQVTPFFDPASNHWKMRIFPGFVNGLDAEVKISRATAPKETLERVGEGESETVFARLTEEPEIEIPLALLRAIGPDATATGTVGDEFSQRAIFEPVPEFFSTFGVGSPPEMEFSAVSGVSVSPSFLGQEALKERRLLRALDVTLTKDRSAIGVQWSAPQALIDGASAQFDLTYSKAPDESERARIGFVEKFEDDPLPELSDILIGAASDTPFDRIHLATIYLMSPSGAPEGAAVEKDWRAFVKHRVFWNLNYSTNRLPVAPPPQRISFPFPLAGGVATSLINSYLAVVNDTRSAALAFLRAASLEGRFWTT